MVEGKSRDAVVISAEAQCCVGALSYTTPGSLIVGRAGALSKMLSDIQLDTQEDDQAVMTDMMVAFPERFVLDYDQQLFGNARWPKEKNGCVFKMDRTGFFQQTETGSHPLFLHTS